MPLMHRAESKVLMPGTRTAPTVDGTPDFKTISVTVYDYSGQQRTDSYLVDADSSDAEVEAFVAALQDLTNATIWRVKVSDIYNSIGDKGNALEEVWENQKTNVVSLLKNVLQVGQDWYIPAPINGMFIDGSEEIDPANADFATYLASILPMRAGYSVISARFSHRRQIGTKINI